MVASLGIGSRSGRFFVLACRPITSTKPRDVMTRPIPHSGEELPIVGLGTAVSFPSADESQRAALKDVIDALVAGGGKLIDTASVYGNAESVIGDIVRRYSLQRKSRFGLRRRARMNSSDPCSACGPKMSICCNSTTSRAPARAYRSSESGKPPAVAAMSGLPARSVRTTTRWKRSFGGRSRILSRLIIRWTIAPQRSASFQRQWMREPRC
jgi:hypothetical protein